MTQTLDTTIQKMKNIKNETTSQILLEFNEYKSDGIRKK